MVSISEVMNQLKCNIDAETMNFIFKNVLFLKTPVNSSTTIHCAYICAYV